MRSALGAFRGGVDAAKRRGRAFDDDEMCALSQYLDRLEDEQCDEIVGRVTLLAALDDRTAYMRRLIQRPSSEPSATRNAAQSEPRAGFPSIPPGLLPVLAAL